MARDMIPPRVTCASGFPTRDDYDAAEHRYRDGFVHPDGFRVIFDAFPGTDVVVADEPDLEEPDGDRPPVEFVTLRFPVGTVGVNFALVSDDGTVRESHGIDLPPDLLTPEVAVDALHGQEWGWTVRVPRAGPYTASTRLRDAVGGGPVFEHRLVVRHYRVVGLGDSFAAGEGNPDEKGQARSPLACEAATGLQFLEAMAEKAGVGSPSIPMDDPAVWLEPDAHRSLLAGHALGVRAVEDAVNGRVITFTPFASTGATFDAGVLGRQHDRSPDGGQVEEAVRAMDGAHVDAVLISIGGNDAGFSSGLRTLATDWRDGGRQRMRDETERRIAQLPERFATLADRFRAELTPPYQVFVTEYPAAFFDAPGGDDRTTGCGVFSTLDVGTSDFEYFGVSPDDADDIAELAHLLNSTIRTIVDGLENWTYVDGIVEGFRGHGYCTDEPYWVGSTTSCQEQGDFLGTMHPNQDGQRVYRQAVTRALTAWLDSHPREPRTWLEPILHMMTS